MSLPTTTTSVRVTSSLGGGDTAGGNDFNTIADVGCGRSMDMTTTTNIDLELDFEVNTKLKNDTATTQDAFKIIYLSSSDPSFKITQLVIDLQHNATTTDNGVFQFESGGFGPVTRTTASTGSLASGSEATGAGPELSIGTGGTIASTVSSVTFTLSPDSSTLTIDIGGGGMSAGDVLALVSILTMSMLKRGCLQHMSSTAGAILVIREQRPGPLLTALESMSTSTVQARLP